jgi:molybdopterin-guanine dinucleotide biosynthesis protein A
MNHIGGIVLAGGHSRRMGTDKATLPFGPELLVQRVVRIVSQAVSPTIVVAAKEQALPALPPEVIVARDQNSDRGPLEGIAAGLRMLQKSFPQLDAAFITACDTPLLAPAFVGRMIELLDASHDAAVPMLDDIPQPLAGVYRIRILPVVEAMLAENRLALHNILGCIHVHFVLSELLREINPDLLSLRNLNTPEDYESALAIAGLPAQHPTTVG